jgi:uncharacterized protein
MSKNVLLIFIRNPELGKVKTRLARTVGDVEALRIYHILLEKTRHAASGCAAERWLMYSDRADMADDWPNIDFDKKAQSSGDLGQRMEAAFQTAFDSGAERVIIIGSDCPQLDAPYLDLAFATLETNDFVIGPVPDGGYCLLGMRSFQPTVFHHIAWSTDTVFAETKEKIQALGGTLSILPMLMDVDTEEDWKDYLIALIK